MNVRSVDHGRDAIREVVCVDQAEWWPRCVGAG
jgi:hypothetical protein